MSRNHKSKIANRKLVAEVGIEPTRPQWAGDFKSPASAFPPLGRLDICDFQLAPWRGHPALVPYRWQDASGTQGRDGLATIGNRKSTTGHLRTTQRAVYAKDRGLSRKKAPSTPSMPFRRGSAGVPTPTLVCDKQTWGEGPYRAPAPSAESDLLRIRAGGADWDRERGCRRNRDGFPANCRTPGRSRNGRSRSSRKLQSG